MRTQWDLDGATTGNRRLGYRSSCSATRAQAHPHRVAAEVIEVLRGRRPLVAPFSKNTRHPMRLPSTAPPRIAEKVRDSSRLAGIHRMPQSRPRELAPLTAASRSRCGTRLQTTFKGIAMIPVEHRPDEIASWR